ncbi:MAG TPA: sigma 54-interacting transcriptional regulator [Candidatus Limnocylindria bacterium]|nr:sigma 54-interacting transcriptional regulator [Candidatus Limnocylindria bacterium]
MVATARERDLWSVLRAMTDGIAQCPNVVLARIWLAGFGSRCEVCRDHEGVDDGEGTLHLVASAGRSRGGTADYGRLDGAFHRFRAGERKIGSVAATGEPLLLTGLQGDERWIANPEWIGREGIRTVAAQPLVFRGKVLGVLAIFDREVLDAVSLEWLRVFADYAAVSIANARAFEEIDVLRARLEEENLYLREEVTAALGGGDFVGESPALQRVLRQVELVAPTEAPVLVTGESGTGKELVARAIHDRSARRERALIKVNCSAVPEALFESEFFGHARGAFTGALVERVGRFELADRGTLFLDEVGELPLAMQAKLLRVLQEGEFERVGDARTRRVDVRVIAATNSDLERAIANGGFREDLFYRLAVFPVHVPPLRERREDVPRLVRHFVERSVRRIGGPAPRVTQAALDGLAAHDWPGNVRELQNVVERAVILARGGGPLRFDIQVQRQRQPLLAVRPEAPERLPTRDELRRHERDVISRALQAAGGKVSGPRGAAELLGMKPTTLASRIRALGLRGRSTDSERRRPPDEPL